MELKGLGSEYYQKNKGLPLNEKNINKLNLPPWTKEQFRCRSGKGHAVSGGKMQVCKQPGLFHVLQ